MNTHGHKSSHKQKHNTSSKPSNNNSSDNGNRKIVRRRYNVTPQTAYHIQELALQEQTTEGHIIDKLMRSYLCERAARYHRNPNWD